MTQLKKYQIATFFLLLLILSSWSWFYFNKKEPENLIKNENSYWEKREFSNKLYKDNTIKSTLREHLYEFKKSWVDYLSTKPSVMEGSIEIGWEIDSKGRVINMDIISSDFKQELFQKEILEIISSIHFPSPPHEQKIYITHNFKFLKNN